MPLTRNPWAVRGLALLVGALLRAVFIVYHPRVAGDALVYGDLAHNLLFHYTFGLTEATVRPTLIRLPGYPLFLAACFAVFGDSRYVPVLWVQGLVDLVSCGLLASLAGRLWDRRAGTATLWLAAVCPFTANYTAAAITETLSVFCVVLAFFSLERWQHAIGKAGKAWRWAVLVGVALGGAVLLRPDQGLLAAAVLPCMLWLAWRGRDASSAGRTARLSFAATVLLFALPLMTWGLRNWRVFHVVQPLAPRFANDPGEMVSYGFQRWYRTWAIDFVSSLDVYWKYDGEVLRIQDLPPRAFESSAQKLETAKIFHTYNEAQAASPWVDAAFNQLARQRISAAPVRYYVGLPLSRELNMWLRPRTEFFRLPLAWWRFRGNPAGCAVALAYAALNAAYLLLAVSGLRSWWRHGWAGSGFLATAMLAFVLLRCALLLTIDNSEPRYTLECFPMVFLLGGLALQRRVVPELNA